MQRYQLRIDGRSVDPVAGVWFETQNPYTGEIWTVYTHFGSDTITYCPPSDGAACVEAEITDQPLPPSQPGTPGTQ